MKYYFLGLGIGFTIVLSLITTLLILQKDKIQQQVSDYSQTSTSQSISFSKPLILENLFIDDHSWVATLPAQQVRTLIATGDVIPGRTVNYNTVTRNNFKWAFEKTAHVTKNADLTLINLENPLLSDCTPTTEGMVFCGDSRHIEGLIFAGVDIASIANNHFGNHGEEGMTETKDLLKKNNMLPSGLGIIAYKEVRGLMFGFLSYNEVPGSLPVPNTVDDQKMIDEIQEARKAADIVVVSFHWGDEYQAQPNIRQKELAHKALDAGADLIIGNHPHWIQPVELYKGKAIMYAHGNFVFDQMWSEKTREGVIGKYTFFDNQLIDIEFIPTYILDYGQPQILEGDHKTRILDELLKESRILNN